MIQTHSLLYLLSLCGKRTGPWTVLLGHFPASAGQAEAAAQVTAPGKVLAVRGRSKAVTTLCCSVPKSQGMKVKPLPKATPSLAPQENANRTLHMQSLTIQLLGSARINKGQMLHGKIYPRYTSGGNCHDVGIKGTRTFLNPYCRLASKSSPCHHLALAHTHSQGS